MFDARGGGLSWAMVRALGTVAVDDVLSVMLRVYIVDRLAGKALPGWRWVRVWRGMFGDRPAVDWDLLEGFGVVQSELRYLEAGPDVALSQAMGVPVYLCMMWCRLTDWGIARLLGCSEEELQDPDFLFRVRYALLEREIEEEFGG